MDNSDDISEVKLAFDSKGQLINKENYKCESYSNDKTKSKKRLFLSLGCCFLFFLFELIFGLIAGNIYIYIYIFFFFFFFFERL